MIYFPGSKFSAKTQYYSANRNNYINRTHYCTDCTLGHLFSSNRHIHCIQSEICRMIFVKIQFCNNYIYWNITRTYRLIYFNAF